MKAFALSSINQRLLISFLLIALLPMLAVTLIAYTISERSLRAEVLTGLEAITGSKAEQIETYAANRLRDVTTIARIPSISKAFKELPNLRADRLGYTIIAAELQPFLQSLLATEDYTDIFLVSPSGALLYSLNGSLRNGTNFLSGEYTGTQLANVITQAVDNRQTELSDFGDFRGQAAAFVAAPVYERSTLLGTVVLQINNQALWNVVTDAESLGQTGETMVGVARTRGEIMIVAPLRFDPDAAFKRTASGDTALQDGLQGNNGQGDLVDYRGQNVVAVWRYLPSLRWAMVVKKDASEAFAPIINQRNLVIALSVLTVLAVIPLAGTVARGIANPIVRLTNAVRAISKGDLKTRVTGVKNGDEIGELAHGFNDMAEQLSSLVNNLEDRIAARTHDLEQRTVQLAAATAAAEQANRSKSVFLANMSHELRTPLNAILGFTQIMERDKTLSRKQLEHVNIISRSGEHLLGLINDVLEMSKIEAGRITLQETPFDLPRLLQTVDEMLRARAEDKNLQLLLEFGELPEYVRGDESKLRQVLINLLGNAIKFTQDGGVVLRAMHENGQLIVEVEDTGRGIPEKDLDAIFQPFVQSHQTNATTDGTGLGLSISRQFIQLMNGDISVKSQVGVGTVFRFTVNLPVVDSTEARQALIKRRAIGIKPDTHGEYRILVVDDRLENRQLMLDWMRAVGFGVREASNGQEAIEVWQA
jgi:signal transduction histidine kinase